MRSRVNPKKNAIVVCCTANWLPLAACTLKSCADHGGCEIADFYVVALRTTDKEKTDFESFAQQNNFKAYVIEANLSAELLAAPSQRFSPAAFLRLTLDQIIPKHYERLLYLDCDILAQSPIGDIFNVDLNGLCLGAVEDFESLPGPMRLFHDHPRSIGLSKSQRYFNSGVLLFDWPQTLKLGLLQKCVEQIVRRAKSGQSLRLPDQDVINLEFASRWQRLPLKYNLMAFFVDYFPQQAVFRHFSNQYKPWKNIWMPSLTQFRKHYMEIFKNSPWPEFAKIESHKVPIGESLAIVLRRIDRISQKRYAQHLES